MNVYFTTSIVGKVKYLANYQGIIDVVKRSGHTITSDHIIKSVSENTDISYSSGIYWE